MVSEKIKHNAAALNRELQWLAEVISARVISTENEADSQDIYNINPPDLKKARYRLKHLFQPNF